MAAVVYVTLFLLLTKVGQLVKMSPPPPTEGVSAHHWEKLRLFTCELEDRCCWEEFLNYCNHIRTSEDTEEVGKCLNIVQLFHSFFKVRISIEMLVEMKGHFVDSNFGKNFGSFRSGYRPVFLEKVVMAFQE